MLCRGLVGGRLPLIGHLDVGPARLGGRAASVVPDSGGCTTRQRPMAIIVIPSTTEYTPSSMPRSTYVASNRLSSTIRPRRVETTPENASGTRKSGS